MRPLVDVLLIGPDSTARVPSQTGPGKAMLSRHAHSCPESHRGACSNLEPVAPGIVLQDNKPDDPLMIRLIVIATLTLLGSACSRTEFAYRNADVLLEYYAWKTVRTSSAQRDHWQPVLQTTLRHHREQELPLVIAYLDLAGHIIREKDGSPGAACLVDGTLFLYQRHARLAAGLAAPLLAELDDTQVRHFARHTNQRQQELVKRYLDPDPQTRKIGRQERITERIEKWTGKLNDSQRNQIRDALERIPDLSASWLAYRAQQTDSLLVMLGAGANTETLRERLDDWWVSRDGTSAEAERSWRIARHEFIQLMDNLATMLTETQRTKLENRLGKLRDDLASFLPSEQQTINLELVPACISAPA